MSTEKSPLGRMLLLAADGLFLGSLLFIHGHARRGALGWPDAGNPGGADLALAAGFAAVVACVLCRPRFPPLAPFFPLAAALMLAALALKTAGAHGVGFGVGRYGTLLFALTWIWIAHLLAALVVIGRRAARGEPAGIGGFVALQAIFGLLVSTKVFAG